MKCLTHHDSLTQSLLPGAICRSLQANWTSSSPMAVTVNQGLVTPKAPTVKALFEDGRDRTSPPSWPLVEGARDSLTIPYLL